MRHYLFNATTDIFYFNQINIIFMQKIIKRGWCFYCNYCQKNMNPNELENAHIIRAPSRPRRTMFLLKKSLVAVLLSAPVKRLCWMEISFFTFKDIYLFYITFRKSLVLQHYGCWIYLDFDKNLANFIMKSYPVIREWDETDWLDPFIC